MRDVKPFFQSLLGTLTTQLQALDDRPFIHDLWAREAKPNQVLHGGGTTCILEGAAIFERGGVAMSDVCGSSLPPAATARNPQLIGRGFRAIGVSLVMHPRNPFIPTAHLNVRFFTTDDGTAWWFGGGYDLTPYFYDEADEKHWHSVAKKTCDGFEPSGKMYERLSGDCDTYFTLKHRNERRGLGGMFYDDLNESHEFGGDFERCFAFTSAVGHSFLDAYLPLVRAHKETAFTEAQRAWQGYRRGRYVEFNLVWDRGTHFGLQSNGRTESILMSMPPNATWQYGPPANLEAAAQRLVERVTIAPVL